MAGTAVAAGDAGLGDLLGDGGPRPAGWVAMTGP